MLSMMAPAEPQEEAIPRSAPHPEPERAALVERWVRRVRSRREELNRKAFQRMREDMAFVRGRQWEDQGKTDERYVANFVQRHIARRTAALYAKNPTVVAKRRQRRDFALWDEKPDTLAQAQRAAMAGDPGALALLQDVEQGRARRRMLDGVGNSLEVLFRHALDEQIPPFKQQLKQCVRRTLITGVGYVKLCYRREMALSPDQEAGLQDMTGQLAALRRLAADMADGEINPGDAEMEELRLAIERLQASPEVVVREGLMFTFPRSTKIIPSRDCSQLRGFVGAGWVAEEFDLTVDKVKEIYGVDLGTSYRGYDAAGNSGPMVSEGSMTRSAEIDDQPMARVWEVYDRAAGSMLTVADGYPDFLRPPERPVLWMERFWPWFVLAFNELEPDGEDGLYPPSDVALLRPVQMERNRRREAERQHRIANRPLYVYPAGALGAAADSPDKVSLSGYEAHTAIGLNGLAAGQKASDLLQSLPKVGLDPNLYETTTLLQDAQMVAGAQSADLGATSDATATESSIAASSRMSSEASNVDDLDEMLDELTGAAAQVLLYEMDPATVQKVVGPGAVWPTWSAAEIAEEVGLSIRAASSGRPNQGQQIANFERMAPLLMQIPGINPAALAREGLERLNDDMDLTEFLLPGMPSIVAMNGAVRPATGDPATDPTMQGGRGAERPGPAGPAGTPSPMGDGAARVNGGMMPA